MPMAGARGSSQADGTTLLPGAGRRLLADLRRLQDEPIPLANASPCSDADLSLWNGVIGCEMEVTHIGFVTVPLHFLIDFPSDYPTGAPNIGFSFEFGYRGGASYTEHSGRLRGKKVICLDILGNFGHVHTEWKREVGSGWSPAYTVSTLLIQLQAVLCSLGAQQSQQERDVTYQTAVRFCERNPGAVLEIMDEEELRDARARRRRREQQLLKACGGDEALADRARAIAHKAGVTARGDLMDSFLDLLSDVASTGCGSHASASEHEPCEPAVDANICCWSTGKLYTESLLGVGLSREKRNLATAAELLSKEAFDGGLRQNTDKSAFEFFLPVWINQSHAAERKEWREVLLNSCGTIGSKVYEVTDQDDAILEVFPRLINQMVVEMMKPEAAKSEAIALFEALCNFWRTFRWLVDTRDSLRKKVGKALSSFVAEEKFRLKDRCPDIGALLVQYTVLQDDPACPKRQDFIDAYSDECSLRWVMWWQRSNTRPEATAVFEATRVSREILMFQMMVIDVVIGDVALTVRDMEASNCKLPARLEELQARWRERKQTVRDWAGYFTCIGATRPQAAGLSDWVTSCARRAADRGPKYDGSKGACKGGKGSAKGKGKGR
ncbi:unnamed protein product [Prorocentrum cordatum]|uniref:UBC core domain-containing protein n=1 Tax=Prorocentrum cordatum TaxID=2364126 RepID=A0ABN9Q7L7_9DINO|nr:unnamed protein product [Polarella glacialis]